MPQDFFTFNRKQKDGSYKPEQVGLEPWRWQAVYKSGLVFNQFDFDTHTFHQFAEIDQSQVVLWRLINDDQPSVTFIVQPGEQLIHFYRKVTLDYMRESAQKMRLYAIGVIRNGEKSIAIIPPSGEVVITNDPDNVEVTM